MSMDGGLGLLLGRRTMFSFSAVQRILVSVACVRGKWSRRKSWNS